MKLPSSSLLRIFLVGAGLLLVAAMLFPPLLHAEEKQLYTCGMHPQIIRDKPGDCPICGMKLQPVRANKTVASATSAGAKSSGERKIKYYKSTMIPGQISQKPGKDTMGMDMEPVYEGEDSSASAIKIDSATIQRMNLKTDVVTRGPVRRALRAVGSVEFNERGLHDITTKYEGWIEKLHVNATWTSVKAGDPLFEVYSPDLYNAQLNYLVALRAEGAAGGPLTRASLDRLKLFDVSADFLAEVAKSGAARRTYLYRSPAAGFVFEKMAVEGQMMKPGEKIYRLADLSTVWVNAQIYEKDLAVVSAGQSVEVRTTYAGERVFKATVAQVLPQVEGVTRTATARLVIENPDGFLRPGMFADVRFSAELAADAVLVPDSAVLRSGERNTVFIALDDGGFVPREVKLGARTDDFRYAVLSGLSAGDHVVISGQFMLDSESQLREAIQKMLRGNAVPSAPSAAPTGSENMPGMKMPETPAPAAEPAGHAMNENSGTSDLPAATAVDPTLIAPLAFATADAAAALATDDLAGYRQTLPPLREALAAYFRGDPHAAHSPLGKLSDGLTIPTDLEAARSEFLPFSTEIADLARASHLHHTAGLHIFECSMKNGRWLQRTAELKNPFLGSAMSTCGTEIDAPAAPSVEAPVAPATHASDMSSMLPPGHPQIGGASITSYLLALSDGHPSGKTAGDGDSCGKCGMSQAAMAAGEPCEHDEK